MASITCKNGPTHSHTSVEESRRCWFPPAAPVAASVAPAPTVRMATPRQRAFLVNKNIKKSAEAQQTTFDEAHKLISEFIAADKAARAGKTNTPTPAPAPVPERRPSMSDDPRVKMIDNLISFIPEGYYATAPHGENGHNDFLRIVTQSPKHSKYRNCLTVQTQHSEDWVVRMVKWPSGKWSVYSAVTIDMVLEVLTDYKTCALRYSVMLKRCMRCGKQLTDDRSRHYLVGPECEVKHGYIWPIDFADDWNGKTYEELRNVGLPFNQHHEHINARAA